MIVFVLCLYHQIYIYIHVQSLTYIYSTISHGYTLSSSTSFIKGTNPFFNEEEVEFWIGKTDWGHPMVFSCLDEDVGSDDLIGGRR